MNERHVYVVDDEEPIRRSTLLMLKVMGYRAAGFENGAEFLKQAQTLVPGCVLLDMRMPDVGGIQVQHALNDMGCPHSIVIMSGHGDRSVAVAAMRAGATAFLEKPFGKAVLERSLEIGFLRIEDENAYWRHLQDAAAAVARLEEPGRTVLAHLARGESSEEIATALALPHATLDMLRARIFTDLGVDSIPEVLGVAFAAERAGTLESRD